MYMYIYIDIDITVWDKQNKNVMKNQWEYMYRMVSKTNEQIDGLDVIQCNLKIGKIPS